jgi:hypothetical protein
MSEINSGVDKIDEILFPKLAALIKDDQNAANRLFVKYVFSVVPLLT